MRFPPVDPRIEEYLRGFATRHDEPVLLEMEQLARERRFPIIGRLVGELVELLARCIGARSVFEMGSGFGYSAYWLTRAVGPEGRVVCTDGSAANRELAERFLSRLGRWDRVEFHVARAQDVLRNLQGPFDIIYCDIDKDQYPEAWKLARSRIRPGGLYLCDNVLWGGQVTRPPELDDTWTQAIQRHNEQVFADPDFDATVIPTRDGLLVARRR